MMHDLWSNRPRGRTQQGPQAQFKLSRSMLHLPSEEVQGAGGCCSNIRRFVRIPWCVLFTFGVGFANWCIQKTILFLGKRLEVEQRSERECSASASDTLGSWWVQPPKRPSFWGPRVPCWSRHLSGQSWRWPPAISVHLWGQDCKIQFGEEV